MAHLGVRVLEVVHQEPKVLLEALVSKREVCAVAVRVSAGWQAPAALAEEEVQDRGAAVTLNCDAL